MTKEEFKRRLIELCVEADVELYSDRNGEPWFQPNTPFYSERPPWSLYIDRHLERKIDQALENRVG